MIVIDASATIALVMNEDSVAAPESIFLTLAKDAVITPSHWLAEIGNAFVSNVRRRRLDRRQFEFVTFKLETMNVRVEPPPTLREMAIIAEMAIDLGLTYYDAAYVDKAHSFEASLFTFDEEMRNAAARLNIPLLPP